MLFLEFSHKIQKQFSKTNMSNKQMDSTDSEKYKTELRIQRIQNA